jgi:hypothetical protein
LLFDVIYPLLLYLNPQGEKLAAFQAGFTALMRVVTPDHKPIGLLKQMIDDGLLTDQSTALQLQPIVVVEERVQRKVCDRNVCPKKKVFAF